MTFHGKEGERESDFDKMRARSGIEIGQKGQFVAMASRRCRNERSKDRRKRKREEGTKRAGGGSDGAPAPRPFFVRRRRLSQGEREAMGLRLGRRGPVACCGRREALLHCNKSGGYVTRGSTAERERDREVLNDLHLRQKKNKGPGRKKAK